MAERYLRAANLHSHSLSDPNSGLHCFLLRCSKLLLNFSLSRCCFLSLVHCSSDLVSSWSRGFGVSLFAKTAFSLLSVSTTICLSPQTFPITLVFYTDWTINECFGDLIFAFVVLSSRSLTVFENQNKCTCLLISLLLSRFSHIFTSHLRHFGFPFNPAQTRRDTCFLCELPLYHFFPPPSF